MKKKKLYKRIEELNLELTLRQKMLDTRIQLVMGPPGKEQLLMNMTMEHLYLARCYGGYEDAMPNQQWIAGPIQFRVILLWG